MNDLTAPRAPVVQSERGARSMIFGHAGLGARLLLLTALLEGVAVGATLQLKCSLAKNKAAYKKTHSLLICYKIATIKGGLFDLQSCITKAQDKFTTAFDKAEAAAMAKGGQCATINDADARETTVDGYVNQLKAP